MRRREVKSIGDVIDQWLKQQNKYHQVTRAGVINHWEDFVGKTIARYTSSVTFTGSKLVVRLTSAVVRRELESIKSPLMERINKEAGSDIVTEIEFTS